jgi:hypothetical protein
MAAGLSSRTCKRALAALALAAIGGWVVANGNALALTLAILTAEPRPALLRDASNDPASAHAFERRFGPGSAEPELETWLRANKFSIDREGHASRFLQSLPCNEAIDVAWTTGASHRIETSSVRVTEAGCL